MMRLSRPILFTLALFALLTAAEGGSVSAAPSATPSAPALSRTGLLVGRTSFRGSGESPAADPLAEMLVAGTLPDFHPSAGEAFGSTGGLRWTSVTLDANGALPRRGDLLYLPATSTETRVMILSASGAGTVYFNGEPRAGDVYSAGYAHLPVLVHPGRNSLLMRGARGTMRATLDTPPAPVYLLEDDKTLPDLVIGERADTWGAVIVVNATTQTLSGLALTAQGPLLAKTTTPLAPIPPLSIRKAGFELAAQAPIGKGKTEGELELRGAGPEPLFRIPLTLNVTEATAAHRRTFRSEIDGSIQYYSLRQAAQLPGDHSMPGIVLTCHGASVEAQGQAAAYAAKPWVHLVAPTNRRPYGFDWEDFGRADAMEVLALVKTTLPYDPARVYLTGHSMGGHGAWHLGVTYPDQFAAIGPSAGWISRETYGGARRGGTRASQPTPLDALLRRGANEGDTFGLANNLRNLAVYILHGAADDNVPADQARRMAALLGSFHRDWTFHEEPGKGHWWGNDYNDGGTACVDWPFMFDLFARHALPPLSAVSEVTFTTANPGVSSRCYWLAIEAQQRACDFSTVTLHAWPVQRAFKGTTQNVAVLRLDVASLLAPGAPFRIELDGQALENIPFPQAPGSLWLAREGGRWHAIPKPPLAQKGPHRYGAIKDELRNRFMFVYGTRGTAEENAWAFNKARFDAETFWYRGNGSVDIVADTGFSPRQDPDRTVVLYGNAETNAAWPALLGQSPVQVRHGTVTLGERSFRGEDISAMFVQPRPGSSRASVIAISGSGAKGMRAMYPVSLFVPFFRYPDCQVTRAGEAKPLAAGYFGLDWSMKNGEFEYAGEK